MMSVMMFYQFEGISGNQRKLQMLIELHKKNCVLWMRMTESFQANKNNWKITAETNDNTLPTNWYFFVMQPKTQRYVHYLKYRPSNSSCAKQIYQNTKKGFPHNFVNYTYIMTTKRTHNLFKIMLAHVLAHKSLNLYHKLHLVCWKQNLSVGMTKLIVCSTIILL